MATVAIPYVSLANLHRLPASGKWDADPRKALPAHAAASGHSLASLSSMLRRSPGYLGRFVRDGVPAALAERDHRLLADVMGVDERALGIRDLWA